MEVITNEKIYFKIIYHTSTYLHYSIKAPSRNFEIPFIQYIESIAPYNDIPNYPEYKG